MHVIWTVHDEISAHVAASALDRTFLLLPLNLRAEGSSGFTQLSPAHRSEQAWDSFSLISELRFKSANNLMGLALYTFKICINVVKHRCYFFPL